MHPRKHSNTGAGFMAYTGYRDVLQRLRIWRSKDINLLTELPYRKGRGERAVRCCRKTQAD